MNFPGTPSKALAMALLFFLLPDCNTEQMNAFDMKVFLRSMEGMSEKVNNLKASVTANRNELLERLESYQNDNEQNYAVAMENMEKLDSKTDITESELKASQDSIADLKRNSETTSLKIALLENILEESRGAIAELRTSEIDTSEKVSNLMSTVTDNKNELLSILENHQNNINTTFAEVTMKTENLDARANNIELGLKASYDTILNLERNSQTTSKKISEIEATVLASQNTIADLRTSVMAPRCHPPSVEIKGLGCVFHIDTSLSWDVQRENCQYRGGRLLEGFTREQFKEFNKLFTLRTGAYFVGIRDQRWYPSAQPIVGLENVWRDKSFACGAIVWGVPDVKLGTYQCETGAHAVCLSDYKI